MRYGPVAGNNKLLRPEPDNFDSSTLAPWEMSFTALPPTSSPSTLWRNLEDWWQDDRLTLVAMPRTQSPQPATLCCAAASVSKERGQYAQNTFATLTWDFCVVVVVVVVVVATSKLAPNSEVDVTDTSTTQKIRLLRAQRHPYQ